MRRTRTRPKDLSRDNQSLDSRHFISHVVYRCLWDRGIDVPGMMWVAPVCEGLAFRQPDKSTPVAVALVGREH